MLWQRFANQVIHSLTKSKRSNFTDQTPVRTWSSEMQIIKYSNEGSNKWSTVHMAKLRAIPNLSLLWYCGVPCLPFSDPIIGDSFLGSWKHLGTLKIKAKNNSLM